MNDNNTDYGEVLRSRYNDISLSSTILIVIGAIIGIVGNCTVIFFYFIRIKERGERYFIPLLAIVDLVACLTSASFYIMDNTFFYNYPNDIVCRLLTFLQVFVPGFSAHILLIVCVQRYLLVCKPFGPKMTLFWKKVSFAAAFLFPLLYSAPLLGISGIKTTDEIFLNRTVQTTICKFSAVDTSAKITAYFGFLGLIIVANIIITAALYIPVLRRIHMSLSKKTTKSVFYKINDGNTSSNIESTSQPTKTSSIDSGTQPSVSNPTNQIVVETTEYDSKPNEMCRNKEFTNVCSNKEPFREDLVKNNHVNNAVKTEEIMDIDNEIKHDGVYTAPLLAISGIKTTDELFLNHTVQTTLCKYYAEDTSASITAYFGFLGLISVVNIIITAALFIPVLRRINISFSGKKWKNVYHINQDSNTSSNTESIPQSNKTCSIDSYTHNYVPNQIKSCEIGVTRCISNPDVNYKKKEF
ncbi:unnamed protein product [Mytilus edulis]|uniref:G-protein coupled receptors family 1 profile domain-containing protein n=1 Tax=Mytilus edulis TaxID=6550 RepID=A0A8S3UV51_MYTED|nr:unnamed protein product [Mytilus edulis]